MDELQKALENELREVLSNMQVPPFRVQTLDEWNLRWLQRNLGINNGDHPQFAKASALVSDLIKIAIKQ